MPEGEASTGNGDQRPDRPNRTLRNRYKPTRSKDRSQGSLSTGASKANSLKWGYFKGAETEIEA
jgi:hypothetical protein